LEIIMGTAQTNPAGPDLAQGVPVDRLPDGRMPAGHVGAEAVLLVQRGDDFFAVGATCTHYGGGAGGRRHRAVSLASRLFQPQDRRSAARSRIQPVSMLENRAARRQNLRAGHSSTAGKAIASAAVKCAEVGGYGSAGKRCTRSPEARSGSRLVARI